MAADFFTVEVWTRRGLQRFVVLFFLELATRKVEIGGIAPDANGLWIEQIGRNLTDNEDGLLRGKKYVIHDRDPLFTAKSLGMLADTGVQSVKLPPKSPNLNAYAEWFVRTIKESCLEKMIWFGQDALRKGVQDFLAHYQWGTRPPRARKPADPSRARASRRDGRNSTTATAGRSAHNLEDQQMNIECVEAAEVAACNSRQFSFSLPVLATRLGFRPGSDQ